MQLLTDARFLRQAADDRSTFWCGLVEEKLSAKFFVKNKTTCQ
jgi:hypothetical protein